MDSDCSVNIIETCGIKMSVMSDKHLGIQEDLEDDMMDLFSYYEEGQHAFISGSSRNPYEEDTYAWKEWERGWKTENRREHMLDN